MNTPLETSTPQSKCRRLVRWLFCWRTARRALLSLGCVATLVAIFYAVENWRGQRAWEKCRRELEAKGVELNWDKLVSPPVPDDQNFYSAPGMADWFIKPKASSNPTNGFYSRLNHPATGSVMERNSITNTASATAYIEWSDQFQPEFNQIREALKRPYARINGNYDQPLETPIPGFVMMRNVVQTLAQRAHCHLLLGQPGEAVHDLTLLHELRRVVEGRPTGKPMSLVAAMINVAIAGVYADAVSEGLRKRAWRESDLVTLQNQLAEVRLLPVLTDAYRCEQAAICRTALSMQQAFVPPIAPRGWNQQNLAAYARVMQHVVEAIDPNSEVVSPGKLAAAHTVMTDASWGSPYTDLIRHMTPNFVRATQTAAHKQTLINETMLACALERFRMAKGTHPESLDALVPKYIAALPHDVLNGQPLKYRRSNDGGFALHSVGWNETDDDGREGAKGSFEDGDWVWRQPATDGR
jgi:hypothetical protein